MFGIVPQRGVRTPDWWILRTMQDRSLTRFAWLSVAAALLTMGIKLVAWRLTGSVGLLSDALESLVNLGAALMAVMMLWLAAQPPDSGHEYGHDKAEYFASGFEGLLIFVAGGLILAAAVPKLLHPGAIERAGLGLALTAGASVINFVVARVLMKAGQRHDSVTLRADAQHLITDVWTSAGVIVAVALVAWTGWLVLDPLIAIVVAIHILWTGFRLLRESTAGLMDAAWPDEDRAALDRALYPFQADGVGFHAVRTRRAARRRFASFHVLVPGEWSVQRGHDLLEKIEAAVNKELPHTVVFTHLEPIEDPVSYDDIDLDREKG